MGPEDAAIKGGTYAHGALEEGELGSSCLSQILHAEQNLMEPKLWSKRPEPPVSSNPKLKPKHFYVGVSENRGP